MRQDALSYIQKMSSWREKHSEFYFVGLATERRTRRKIEVEYVAQRECDGIEFVIYFDFNFN